MATKHLYLCTIIATSIVVLAITVSTVVIASEVRRAEEMIAYRKEATMLEEIYPVTYPEEAWKRGVMDRSLLERVQGNH